MIKGISIVLLIAIVLTGTSPIELAFGQTLEKMRLGYSSTGLNNYVLEMGRRAGLFRKNGLDLEIVYVNSGSLLNQALIAGTFDISFSQGSEAMMAKLRGADMRITAVVANRFNHDYLTAPAITSIKQLKGKKVAVSRFGSGSHFQSNLALKEGVLDPEKDVTILQIGISAAAKAVVRTVLRTDDVDTIEYATMRSIRVLDRRPFPTVAGIQTVLDELGKEPKAKSMKFEDFVDLRALRALEQEGVFK